MNRDDPEDGPRRGTEQRQGLTRRRLVAAGTATWASAALAGCDRIDDPGLPDDGSDGDDGGDGDGGDGTPTGGTTVSNRTTTTGGDGGTPAGNETTTTTPPPTTTECANVRRFAAGMDVGLHVDVLDSESGEYLGAEGLDRVRVTFPEAPFESLDLSWEGPHEQFSSEGWGGKVVTDPDVEPGTYRYEITVEGAGVDGGTATVVDEFTIV